MKLWARVSCLIFLRHSVCLDRFSCFCTVHPYTQRARRQTHRQTHRHTHTQIYRPSNVGYMSRIYAKHAIRPKFSSVLSFDNRVIQKRQVCFRLPTYADNVALLAFARRYLLLAEPTAANLQQRVCCCGPILGHTDGRTDGRTQYRSIDPAPRAMRGVPNWRRFERRYTP